MTLLRLAQMASIGFLLLCATIARADSRPNFIFIFTDDQRYDAMSIVQAEQGEHGRFPWFKTPNMDRLAREGMRFRNAFVVNSLCAPSRASILTSRYSHLNGVQNNRTPLPLDSVTHASVLRAAGYTTAYFGKWHLDGQKQRPGFDHFASFVGQGQYIDCPLMIDGKLTPTHGWIDDITTDYAIDFLKKQKDSGKPFDIVFGFKSPHDPRTPPARAKDRFPHDVLQPAPNLGTAFPPYHPSPPPAPKDLEHNHQAILAHFRCVSAADDCLGRILDTLDELKLADNTVVVFSSDNGYFFGEHGLGDKRAAYEESMRVPMLVRYPGHIKPGSVSDAMVLNIDYAPTILDLAGVKIPEQMQGRSWKPLFAGKSDGWRDGFFYEYFLESHYKTPTMTAVRTAGAKLILYPGHADWTELFDLAADPFEMKNLAHDVRSAELMKTMKAAYDREAQRVKFAMPADLDPEPASFDP